jgi:hypothetical protein
MITSGTARQWPVARWASTRVTQAGRAHFRSPLRSSPRATRFAPDLGYVQPEKTESLQAVVIGGSISGMLAARTLSRFAEVVIIEMDDVHVTGVRQESFKEVGVCDALTGIEKQATHYLTIAALFADCITTSWCSTDKSTPSANCGSCPSVRDVASWISHASESPYTGLLCLKITYNPELIICR